MGSCGSPNYAAPELLQKKCAYEGPEVDSWACGVILYVLLTNSLPFDEDDIPRLFRAIKKGQFKMPGYISADAKDLISAMLEMDRTKRLTIAQVRNHRWLAKETALSARVPSKTVAANVLDHQLVVKPIGLRSISKSAKSVLRLA